MSQRPVRTTAAWKLSLLVFAAVLGGQLVLVKLAGTDIPFMDQWDVEGRWLYPAWREGSLHFADLFRPHNEHRIVWTHLLNLLLFQANGNHWDPLVQLVAGALLHAICAAILALLIVRALGPVSRWLMALAVILGSVPLAGWHNALWGFQSQVYFTLLFALLAFALLDGSGRSRGRIIAGWLMGAFALFAMGPGVLVLGALLGLAGLQCCATGKQDWTTARKYWPVVPLLFLAAMLRENVPAHAALRTGSVGQFITVAGRVLAWPHVGQPLAALALNIPFFLLVLNRFRARRQPVAGENFVLLAGGWSLAIALATAWSRGGSAELETGVPSRYADLIMLLPLARVFSI